MVEDPKYFFSEAKLENWFEKNHATLTSQWIGLTKPKAKKQAVGYKIILDFCLCFGWIDGVRKSIDDERWMIRFSPRKKTSIWSAVNLKRMNELIAEGRVKRSGLKVYEERDPKKAGLYSFENKPVEFSPELEKLFHKNKKAWNWFKKTAPSYQNTLKFWVMSPKQEETRIRRMKKFIADAEAERKIKELSYEKR